MKSKQIKRTIDTSLAGLRVTERDVQRIMIQVREGKQVKKKLSVGLVLAVVLILLTVTAVGVGVMSGLRYWDAKDADIGSPLDMVALNDRVYLTTEDGFFQWDPVGEKATVLTEWQTFQELGIEPAVSLLFVHDDSVMLLSQTAALWRFDVGHWRLENSYARTPLANYIRRESALVYQDGYLFMPGRESENMTNVLLRLNLSDGSIDKLPVGDVLRLCAYRDGKVLAVINVDGAEERLVLIDTMTGEVTAEIITMHLLAMNGLAYDEQSDRIYAMVDGALSVWDGLQWHALCKASLPGLSHSYCVVDDLYIAASSYGIQSIQIAEQAEVDQRALTIRGVGAFSSTLDHPFQQSHPNLAVSRSTEGHFCAKEVEEAIRNGDKTDLFHISLDVHWLPLVQSGLLAPIRSDALEQEAEDMAEIFRQLVIQDGTLYAIPSTATIAAWNPLGTDLPATYTELLMNNNAALTWTSRRWFEEEYVEYMLEQQIMENGTLFDTRAFRESLSALKTAKWDMRAENVFNTSTGFSMGNLSIATGSTAPTRIDENSAEHYPMYLYMYVLNPNSENKEAALAFLEYAVSRMDEASRAILAPETAQPMLLPFAEQWIEEVKIQHAQDVKDGLLPDDPAALEERIENIRNMPGHQSVTQEAIDLYREKIFPNLDMQMHPLLGYHSRDVREQMQNEVMHYLGDEISLDDLIEALNRFAKENTM